MTPPDLHGDGADGEVEVVALDGELLLDLEAASDEEIKEFGLALAFAAGARERGGDGAFGMYDGLGKKLAWSAAYGVSPISERAALLVAQTLHPETIRGGGPPDSQPHLSETTLHRRSSYPEALTHREDAVAALVTLTDVVEVEIKPFHGYVYNLDTGNGWYTAGTIACRNCRCTMTYEGGTPPEGSEDVDTEG